MRYSGQFWAVPAIVMMATTVQAADRIAPGTEARNAKAAFVYLSQATKDAALKPLDAALIEQRKRADQLGAKLAETRNQLALARKDASASKSRLAELERLAQQAAIEAAEAQEKFTQELAAKDADYARELAILRSAADDILATPEGLKYLEANNAGDLDAADAIEEKLIAARQKMRDLQAAADRRAFAVVALDNANKGLRTTAAVITRFEEVARLDPGHYQDWATLSSLYLRAGNTSAALDAAYKAQKTAKTDDERISASVLTVFSLMRASRYTEALDLVQSALRSVTGPAGSTPGPGMIAGIGQLQFSLGATLERLGQIDAAISAYATSVETARQHVAIDPSLAARRGSLAERLTKLGALQLRNGALPSSLASVTESVTIRRELVAAYPAFIAYRSGLAISLSDLATVTTSMKRIDEAIAAADEIIAIMTPVAEKDASVANLNLLAYGHTTKGLALVKSGRFDDAVPVLGEGIELATRLVAIDPSPGASHFRLLGNGYDQLGNAKYATGAYEGACAAWTSALELATKRADASSNALSDQVSIAIFQVKRGRCLKKLNDRAGAAQAYLGALPLMKAALAMSPLSVPYREAMTEILSSLLDMEVAGFSRPEVETMVKSLIAQGQADPGMMATIDQRHKAAAPLAGDAQ